jgi:hypothetical protein
MHEYLLGVESAVETSQPGVAESAQSLIRLDALGDTALLILLVMGGGIWIGISVPQPARATETTIGA